MGRVGFCATSKPLRMKKMRLVYLILVWHGFYIFVLAFKLKLLISEKLVEIVNKSKKLTLNDIFIYQILQDGVKMATALQENKTEDKSLQERISSLHLKLNAANEERKIKLGVNFNEEDDDVFNSNNAFTRRKIPTGKKSKE